MAHIIYHNLRITMRTYGHDCYGIFIKLHPIIHTLLSAPLKYITCIFYTLFGQGCSLLALRAKSNLEHEKTNFYFTIAIWGIILISLIFLLTIFFFTDSILNILNTPEEIFNDSKGFLLIQMFFYPLNCYIMVISFFIRSDGFPKIPFLHGINLKYTECDF